MTGKNIKTEIDTPTKEQEDELDKLEEKLKKDGLVFTNRHFEYKDVPMISDALSGNYQELTGYKKIVFKNCHFIDLTIRNKVLSIPFVFEKCSFVGETHFFKCIFSCNFSFAGSSFFNSTITFCDLFLPIL